MLRITEEDVEKMRADLKTASMNLLDRTYEKVLDDPILIPMTWRIWTMIGISVWTCWSLVVVPICNCAIRTGQKVYDMDVTFICLGLIITSLCLLTAIRSMRRKHGKNWNKWLKKRGIPSLSQEQERGDFT